MEADNTTLFGTGTPCMEAAARKIHVACLPGDSHIVAGHGRLCRVDFSHKSVESHLLSVLLFRIRCRGNRCAGTSVTEFERPASPGMALLPFGEAGFRSVITCRRAVARDSPVNSSPWENCLQRYLRRLHARTLPPCPARKDILLKGDKEEEVGRHGRQDAGEDGLQRPPEEACTADVGLLLPTYGILQLVKFVTQDKPHLHVVVHRFAVCRKVCRVSVGLHFAKGVSQRHVVAGHDDFQHEYCGDTSACQQQPYWKHLPAGGGMGEDIGAEQSEQRGIDGDDLIGSFCSLAGLLLVVGHALLGGVVEELQYIQREEEGLFSGDLVGLKVGLFHKRTVFVTLQRYG